MLLLRRISVITALLSTIAPLALQEPHLIAHEWGTFTSVVGEDGTPIAWRSLRIASDLPSFVYGVGGTTNRVGSRNNPDIKGFSRALVRMETPVIYFYSDRDADVSVKVDFPQGRLTEWYPSALQREKGLSWEKVCVRPDVAISAPMEEAESHYYHARETDASPLLVPDAAGDQHEKFLFYRGVGNFQPPVQVRLNQDSALVTNLSGEIIQHVVLFEKRESGVGFEVSEPLIEKATIRRPFLNQSAGDVRRVLQEILESTGLYRREARAMVHTWSDSWFEDGLRLFYVLPKSATDKILPLAIDPPPSEIVRVIVGRIEIITPEIESEVRDALSVSDEDRARRVLAKYHRFAEPILIRALGESEGRFATVEHLLSLVERSRAAATQRAASDVDR